MPNPLDKLRFQVEEYIALHGYPKAEYLGVRCLPPYHDKAQYIFRFRERGTSQRFLVEATADMILWNIRPISTQERKRIGNNIRLREDRKKSRERDRHKASHKPTLMKEDEEELRQLRAEFYSASLGDRPHCPAAAKIRRLCELEALERQQ